MYQSNCSLKASLTTRCGGNFASDSIKQDSITYNTKITIDAKWDARKIRLARTNREKFNASGKNPNSDLFKPRNELVSNTALLVDSVYVKAFRLAAYKKALAYKKGSVAHCFLIGGLTIVGVYATIGLILMIGSVKLY